MWKVKIYQEFEQNDNNGLDSGIQHKLVTKLYIKFLLLVHLSIPFAFNPPIIEFVSTMSSAPTISWVPNFYLKNR